MLEPARPHTPYSAHLHVEVRAQKSSPEPATPSFDLDELARTGVVVRKTGRGDRLEVSLGTPKNALWPDPQSALATPRLFVDITVSPEELARDASIVGLPQGRLELLLPKAAYLASMGEITVQGQVAAEVGAPVDLRLTTTLHEAPRIFEVSISLQSFVRDVVVR